MRKYQQLLLLLISCLSVTVLIMYKSENNRLKYVLSVVNFFGRNDAAVLRRLENFTRDDNIDFTRPLPVWQAIGDSFHCYSAYWNRNELVAGGEVLALVAGKRGAVVNFRCTVLYDAGTRSVQAKFHFQRVDNEFEDSGSDFTMYNFVCRLTRDFGQPESVIFTDISSANKLTQKLRLRYIRALNESSLPTSTTTTICVDLVSFNSSSAFARDETKILQFFLHHHVLGIEHFLVYNADELPKNIIHLLRRTSIHMYLLPFNFPFVSVNSTERLRRIVETDCLMRNLNYARHTVLLAPNEFFYPNAKVADNHSVLRSIYHYSANIKRFELPTFAVCMDQSHKLLADNTLHDPEVRKSHRLFVYRPHVPITTVMSDHASADATSSSVALSLSMALAHQYIACMNIGKDGLHDWRNSLRQDFMQHIEVVRNEVDVLI